MIRTAEHRDIEYIIPLAYDMHQESRFCVMEFDAMKVVEFLYGCVESDDHLLLVAERKGKIIGGFAGYVVEHWFSPEKIAGDFALFVHPDKRGGLIAAQLIKHYANWAKSKGCKIVQLGVSTGVKVNETARLFEHMNFAQIGTLHEYRGDA